MMKIKNIGFILILLMFFLRLNFAEAHMPGAKPPPEFKLKPIVLNDNEKKIKITIEDVAKYHGDKCPCTCCAFRAVLLGIQKLWGKEIPDRDDIKIISRLPSSGSIQCFEYIVGTGGEFVLLRRKKRKTAGHIGIDNWNFVIVRKSTGDKFEVQVKDNVHPQGFFNLRKKVKIEKSATKEELDEFRTMWEETRDAFLTKADWELFEGVKEPFPVGGAVFFSLLIIGAGSLSYVKNRGNKKSFKRA